MRKSDKGIVMWGVESRDDGVIVEVCPYSRDVARGNRDWLNANAGYDKYKLARLMVYKTGGKC